MIRKVDISHKTIFFIAAFLIALWIIYLILDIILVFFVAFILMSALSPLVDRLAKLKVPRGIAILLVFLLIALFLSGILTLGFTPLLLQTSSLSQKLADTIGLLISTNLVDQSVIQQELSGLSRQIVDFTFDFFRNLISFISVIVITFYLLLDKEKIEGLAVSFAGSRKEKARKFLQRTEDKLGAWLRGQLILSITVGVVVYIGLTALGIEYALPLAILAGLFEVVPVIGPIISSIPGILLGLTVSPLLGGLVAGMYLAVQQTENHILVPQIMKRAVGLNPILVILAVSLGSRLLGIGGALLAVPIAVVIQVILQEVLSVSSEDI